MEVFTGCGEADSYEYMHETEAFNYCRSSLGRRDGNAWHAWPHSGIVLPITYNTENNGT
jgi:carbohydrate-selective porin OprB